jgi:hypothetical protein
MSVDTLQTAVKHPNSQQPTQALRASGGYAARKMYNAQRAMPSASNVTARYLVSHHTPIPAMRPHTLHTMSLS